MALLPRLRRHRLWLVCVSLALGLPWLALAGNSRCPLLAARSFAPAADAHGCCQRCCPPAGGVQPSAPVPPLSPAAVCCAPFKACLPANAAGSRPGWLQTPASPRGRATFPDSSAFAPWRAGAAAPAVSVVSWPLPPPGAFLRTVARRCCPSHAPPTSAAFLS